MQSTKTETPSAIRLVVSHDDPEVAYLYLTSSGPKDSKKTSARQVSLRSIIPGYSGADLIVDFDASGRAMGVEILL